MIPPTNPALLKIIIKFSRSSRFIPLRTRTRGKYTRKPVSPPITSLIGYEMGGVKPTTSLTQIAMSKEERRILPDELRSTEKP